MLDLIFSSSSYSSESHAVGSQIAKIRLSKASNLFVDLVPQRILRNK